MTKRGVKIEDLRDFVFVSDPQVSPDGRRVAFVYTAIDYGEDDYVKHVWMLDTGTGKTVQFTHGVGKDSSPQWSPDGSKLLFLSSGREPEKKSQLYVINSEGGEAQLAADMETGIMNPAWAPNGRDILFTSRVWAPEKPETDVVVVKRIWFKLNGVGMFAGKRVHLFTVRPGRKPKQLTKGEFDVEAAAWSPDGKEIAFVSNMESDQDATHVRHIYLMPAKGGETRRITSAEHEIGALRWSPDGDEIAYLGDDFHARGATNTDIWVIPSDGGEPRNLTAALDRSIGRGIGSDLRVSTPNPSPVWSSDGGSIYFLTGDVPTSNVYKVDKASGEVTRLTSGYTVDGFSFSGDFKVLAYNAMTATAPCELWVRDSGGERKATGFNDRLMKKLAVSTPEPYTWANELGDEITGWVMKPTGYEDGAKYPTILQIHGGPLSIYGDAVYQEFQMLATAGYCVIYTNPRGSGGYGEEYGATLNGRHGAVDYRDVMDFTEDAVKRFSFIDRERLGVTGGSYGGYLTNWIISQTDLFKAAVACRSTCNRHSHHGYSDLGYKHGESGNVGYPWRDEEKLLAQSPLRHASNVKTPTLFIHSENDLRCTIQQAEEFFVALKELGVDTEMVRFPGESHELSRSGKPKHREERLRHILGWFDKYLK
ncbi:S9 family peptidase [Candidatus Bathyarchaeota archaeon]|nr:S9 family peptidase [Candidatus Bathyarchaeota archaeon]